MGNELILDPIKHVYSLNGRYLPGVSGILKKAGLVDLSGIPEDVLSAARDFGTAVHKACELHDAGTLDVASLSEPLVPYLDGWKKFLMDTGAKVIASEMGIYSARWWYAGTLDRIVIMGEKLVLIDIKSSSTIYPSMKIQLSAYKTGYEEMTGKRISQRLIVQLGKDGLYKLHPCNDENDIQVFLAAVQIYKFKKQEANYYDRNGNGF